VEDRFPEMEPSAFAPGMTMPVVAGEQYTLKDIEGESLVIEGRDDPLTVDFIRAYDEWLMFTHAGMFPQATAASARLRATFEALPNRIKDQLPSRRMGVIVTGVKP
jgi:hypothetical protein